MKNREDQRFSLDTLVFPLVGLGLLISLAFFPFGRLSGEDVVIKNRARAEVLAYEVAQLYRESLTQPAKSNTRGPASEAGPVDGFIGLDTWGNAYRYSIIPSTGNLLRIEIRSAGPNGKFEEGTSDDVSLIVTL